MQSKLSKKDLKNIIQWDVKNWKNALPYWSAHFDIRPGMKVLALGEREGGMSLYFAKLGCEVFCTDYNEMPESTKLLHEKEGVSSSIQYKKIDIRSIDFQDNEFDVVVFKSVIGTLGNKKDQHTAVTEIHRVLQPGGAFLFAENAEGSALHRKLRAKYVKWAEHWRYIDDGDIRNWKKLFTSSKVKSYGFTGLFGRSEKQRNVIGTFDKITAPITPSSWMYIYFGVLIK